MSSRELTKSDDQLEQMERESERESKGSVLSARIDDDDYMLNFTPTSKQWGSWV